MRSRILDSYLARQMLINWSAVTVVLLVIMVGNVLARTLTQVTDGAISADSLMLLVGIKSINLLVTLIPLGLYLGILLAHGRMYRDNEMAVLQACGVSWRDLLRPTLFVGLIGMVIILVLTLFVSPWAYRYEQQIRSRMQQESGVSLLMPGRFNESQDGSTVFFAHDVEGAGTRFLDVFMMRKQEDQPPQVNTAEIASYQVDAETQDEYLVFSDGQMVIGTPGASEYSVTDFRHQGFLRPKETDVQTAVRTKGKTMSQLWGSSAPADQAQLQWRLSIPFAAVLLSLLAVPLGYMSPRDGRYSRIAVAILIYIPYANLLVLARKWIENGSLHQWIGLWPVHLAVVVLILWMLQRRVGMPWIKQAGWRGI